jgi:hypothetical protein
MKPLLILALILPLAAQTPPAATAPAAQAAPQAEAATTAGAPAAAPGASPLPSAETWLTGYIDIAYQARTDVGGSFETWRSIVNLGSGPKLTGTDFTILDPKRRLFDRVRVRAYDWGDNPYSSFHLFAEKQGAYEINAEYRRLAYFNDLPSYADPLLGRGIALDEQSFDTRRRIGAFSLDLLPGRMLSPYLAYDRDSSSGHGVTVFQSNNDEFAVPDTTRDSTNVYRGGIHLTRQRFHLTLEEGGTTFKDDQNTFTATTLAPNPGNNPAPVFGQTLGLSGLLQDYGVRGTSVYSKAIVTANPFSWMDFYGTYIYSEPKNNLNYQQYNSGNFVLLSQLLFYTSEQYLVAAVAKLPHTTANLGLEVRPVSGLRILESWSTDRLHNAGSAAQADTFIASGTSTRINNVLQSALATNYNQNETTVIGEVSKAFTLRGGYRYVWGNADDAVLPAEGLLAVKSEELRRKVGLGAVTWRPGQKFSFTGELEAGNSTGVYFRTSLYNYTKFRAIGRYRLTNSLQLSANYNILNNRNPNVDAAYKFLVHQESLALNWIPTGKKFDFEGSYEHCGYHSRISYLVPQILAGANSVYSENCHTISGYFNGTYRGARLMAGGSAVLTSGSRPTTYYQPIVKLSVPLHKNVGFFTEWRYYGFGEAYYMYEAFRAHLFTTGLRFSR